jgi:hypothetical protein
MPTPTNFDCSPLESVSIVGVGLPGEGQLEGIESFVFNCEPDGVLGRFTGLTFRIGDPKNIGRAVELPSLVFLVEEEDRTWRILGTTEDLSEVVQYYLGKEYIQFLYLLTVPLGAFGGTAAEPCIPSLVESPGVDTIAVLSWSILPTFHSK